MRIFTKYGFFSVVCARQRQGEREVRLDPDLLMVRARSLGHLKALKKRFPELPGGAEILLSTGTDYRFRIVVEKAVWSRVASGMVEEISYGNFKDEVARVQGRAGYRYEQSLHEVWRTMWRFQRSQQVEG